MSDPKHSHDPLVILMPSGRRGRVEPGTSLLDAARNMGVEIESICGGRLTCGKCKVRIEDGLFQKHGITSSQGHVSPPTQEEMELLQNMGSADCRLSCVARVQGDILAFVPEESRAQKQIIRKSATERVIEVAPAIRKVYVKVDEAQLGDHRGDWGRVQDALREQWQIEAQTIDLLAMRKLQKALRDGRWKVTVTLWHDREAIDVRAGYEEGVYGLAVDIGSTTVVGHLCDLRTGQVLATESMMNPQVTYGEDLMSRISYVMMHSNGLEKQHKAIIDALNTLAARAAKAAGIRSNDIHEAVFVGNTTMIHLFLDCDPVELGGSPFAVVNRDPLDIKARDLGLRMHPGAYVHVLPAEAGHVGADNVGVLIAEEPYRMEDISLTVDVGTNAEIVVGGRDWMFSASSPTGPAFEGAQITYGMRAAPGAIERVRIDPATLQPRFRVIGEERWSDEWPLGPDVPLEDQPKHLASGICGSGIIEVIAEMLISGVILPDGRFNPNNPSERIVWKERKGNYILAAADQTTTGEPIYVTQSDVRNIQLAKAALYAGAKLLLLRAGMKKFDRVILAGAFGSYIDPKHAMVLGLIPDCDLAKVTAVGNAAGDGARIALVNRHKREEARYIARWVRSIEIAMDPIFQEEFVAAMHLPHASDSFPHLEGILPQADATPVGAGRERRSRSARQSSAA